MKMYAKSIHLQHSFELYIYIYQVPIFILISLKTVDASTLYNVGC